MKKEMIMLTNLNCPSCAANVENAFNKMAGVKAAAVAFGTGMLTIEYDESQVMDETIERTLESFGVGIGARM